MKNPSAPFQKVVIVGMGLIGGSLALEFKRGKFAEQVIGVSRSVQNRKAALQCGALDEAYAEIDSFVEDADLIILATPVTNIVESLKKLKPLISQSALVTDVGSTKKKIVDEARRLKLKQFVGGHPIAGTEKSGMMAAELDLFAGKKWILTPLVKHPALKKFKSFLKDIGAELVEMKSELHDEVFASTSHVPNLLAYALAGATAQNKAQEKIKLAGSSIKGMTRVASSPPEMWRDICLTNSKEISRALKDLQKQISKLQKAIHSQNPKALMTLLEQGRRFRKSLEKVS